MAVIISVREANASDRGALWDWRRDQVTRKMFALDSSVQYREFCQWYDAVCNGRDSVLLIGLVETLRIGCVLFVPRTDRQYDTRLYLKPPYCGNGYGSALLAESLQYMVKARHPSSFYATVSDVNSHTKPIYETAGFECVKEYAGTVYFEWQS